MTVDPASLVPPLLIAAVGIIGAWAVLRATVADLKRDVLSMRELIVTVQLLKATQDTHAAEIGRVRSWGEETRNRQQDIAERVAAIEARIEEPTKERS